MEKKTRTNALMKFCYDESDGSVPVVDFLLSLDADTRAWVMTIISLLRDNGYDMHPGHYEFEFATSLSALTIPISENDTIVIPYFLDEFPDGVVEFALVSGFIRHGFENPVDEVQKAERIIDDYLDA